MKFTPNCRQPFSTVREISDAFAAPLTLPSPTRGRGDIGQSFLERCLVGFDEGRYSRMG